MYSSLLLTIREPKKGHDWSGIRTHASEETSALNWRLRPLGHPTGWRGPSASIRYPNFVLLLLLLRAEF